MVSAGDFSFVRNSRVSATRELTVNNFLSKRNDTGFTNCIFLCKFVKTNGIDTTTYINLRDIALLLEKFTALKRGSSDCVWTIASFAKNIS